MHSHYMPVSPETFELLVQILTGGGYKDTKFLVNSMIKKKERLEERYQTKEPEMWQGEGSLILIQQFAVVWWAVCVE